MQKTREEIQRESLKKLEEKNFIGTVVLSTGTGKTRIAINAIKKGEFSNILITSPRTNLKNNWKEELEKWGLTHIEDTEWGVKVYNDDNWHAGSIEKTINITIENVQTAYKWEGEELTEFDLVIFDEIHTMTTPKYGRIIKLAAYFDLCRIGLTATPDIIKKDEKMEFYKLFCPIIYEYNNSEKDGITNKKLIYALRYNLTDDVKYKVETKTKSWVQGELSYYNYLESVIEETKAEIMSKYPYEDVLGVKAVYALKNPSKPPEMKKILGRYWWAITQRKKLLWNLNSSANLALTLKNRVLRSRKNRTWKSNKVLLFSELTSKSQRLSEYYINSKQDVEHNQKMIEMFNSGKIKELASCQSLTLGMNLRKANYAIFESFNSSETNNLQKQGRLNRLPLTEEAVLIYIVPRNTQAEVWFEKATENQEVREINVNQII